MHVVKNNLKKTKHPHILSEDVVLVARLMSDVRNDRKHTFLQVLSVDQTVYLQKNTQHIPLMMILYYWFKENLNHSVVITAASVPDT